MNVITFNHETIDTIDPITTGTAPDFTLTDLKGHKVSLSSAQKPVLISVFPDINTSVCSMQTRYFNEAAARRKDIEFLSISNNSANELHNWCAAENIDMTILPDDGTFGDKYRLRMYAGPMKGRLARSIFVVKNGKIVYSEIVNEISNEPNYKAALDAATIQK